MKTNHTFFYFAEKLCPDNCMSQSQGTCDITSGKCNCTDEFVGANCAIKIPSNAECKSDLDCPEDKCCFDLGGDRIECRSPCDQNMNVCGFGAECEVKDRKAICTCSGSKWTGNPDPYVVGLISEQVINLSNVLKFYHFLESLTNTSHMELCLIYKLQQASRYTASRSADLGDTQFLMEEHSPPDTALCFGLTLFSPAYSSSVYL